MAAGQATLISAIEPQQPILQIINTNVGSPAAKQWSPLVAGFLSFLIPGLGQIYNGQWGNGIVWFIAVFIGYVALIIPGLILHGCCILGALMGDPYWQIAHRPPW